MRFQPCQWRNDNLRAWSPQRLAAARRAVAKEADRVEAKRAEVGLFPELQQEIQPKFTNVEERQHGVNRHELFLTRTFRETRARKWREARTLYFALSPIRRAGAIALWSVTNLPADPVYFIEFIRKYSAPGHSPWTYLRKRYLCRLWAQGLRPRPDNFLSITSTFDTLGPVRHQRLRDQTLTSLARHRGISLREIKKQRSA